MGDIKELKATYDNCIRVQNDVISINRKKLGKAEKNRDYEEMRRLRHVLNILYDEKTELEYLALSLSKYA
ncbi:MAG: hypothetical protein ACI4F5_08280 [Acutalibacteraceae bacterium]